MQKSRRSLGTSLSLITLISSHVLRVSLATLAWSSSDMVPSACDAHHLLDEATLGGRHAWVHVERQRAPPDWAGDGHVSCTDSKCYSLIEKGQCSSPCFSSQVDKRNVELFSSCVAVMGTSAMTQVTSWSIHCNSVGEVLARTRIHVHGHSV